MRTRSARRMRAAAMNAERPTIVVLDDYERALRSLADWSQVDRHAEVRVFHEPLRGDVLHAALVHAEAIVLMRDRTPLRGELIDRLPNLKLVVFTGSRNAALDTAALARRGIPVCHTDWGPSKDTTCELTWALILAATRRLEAHFTLMRGGNWRDTGPLAGRLAGERLGLIGLGEIGSRVARVGLAFGMQVAAWSPHMTAERAAAHGATAVPLDELLATAKVISLHLVASAQTRQLIGTEQLASMRSDALLVNTSRSSLIDMAALTHALAAGQPAMAALDVYDEEPLPPDHPLRRLHNVVLTPHLGFVAQPVFERFAAGVVECLSAWLHGDALVRVLAP
jgi:phosphoglycerate dehydrogenase-like enzyme